MNINFVFLVSLGIVLSSGWVSAYSVELSGEALPGCELRASGPVHFKSSTSHDTLTLRIGPGNCYAAKFNLSITDPRGHRLYTYSTSFKSQTATQWNDPGMADEAHAFIARILRDAIISGKELPDPHPPVRAGDLELKVSEAAYQHIRASQQPILRHFLGYETEEYIIFDAKSGRAIPIAEYGD